MGFLEDLVRGAQQQADRMFAQPAPKKPAPTRPGPLQMGTPRGPQLQGPVQQAPAYVQRAPQRLQVVGGPAYQPVPQRPGPIDIAAFARTLASGIQQSGGNLADMALMGGSMVENSAIDINPFTSEKQKKKIREQSYKNTEKLRDFVKQEKTVTGESLNARPDFQFTGDPMRDAGNLAGRSLQTGLDATMFVNPTRAGLAGLSGKQALGQVAKTAGKEAALFGGGAGTAAFAETYGKTGDINQAIQAGLQTAALAGTAQVGLNVGGYAVGKGTRGAINQGKQAVELHNSMTPAQRQRGSVQLPGGPDYKPSKTIIKAEDDFANGKINVDQLEKIRQADAQVGVKTPVKPADLTPDQAKSYIDDMTKAQKEAQKGTLGLRDKTSDFKEKFIDDLAPIEDRLNKAVKAGVDLDPRDHISYQLDRSRRSEGIMNAYIGDNGLDKIIQNVPDPKEFDQYLIARHAKELDPEVKTGRNAANDAAIVKQYEGKYGQAAQEVYKYNQKLLDTSVEYGLISKELATSLRKQYPEYVPFNRIFNEDELANIAGGNGKGDASIATQGVVKKIKGSERAISSPLNSIIDKTRVVIEQGERNAAAKLLASYKDLPGNPFNLKEIPANETIGTRDTISFLDNGVKRTFETDKAIADAAKNMSRQDIGLWGRIAAVPARVLRGGATTVNVGFAGANIVKDVVGAAINSKHPFRIADPEAFGKALSAALNHKGKAYQEMMREGVSGTSFDMFRNPLKSNVAEIRSQKSPLDRAEYILTHPGQLYRTVENTIGRSEDFGRALQYYSNKKGFKAEGKTDDVAKLLAADQARHNSTNFYRHGSIGQGVNLAIPYWNAGVQGARIQARRIGERPAQTLGKMAMVIAGPSAMIAMNNYMDPRKREVIENIPDYEKEGNIIIVGNDAKLNPDTGKWEGVYKFPVPPQHIGIHKTVQDAVRATAMGEPFDVIANLGRVTEDYTTINPTDPKALANRYVPQALKLAAEPLTNTNFYTGNKIVPDSQKNLPNADQYNEYSSGTAKTLGKLTNLSPRQIDNTIRTGLGGAGQNLVRTSDNLLAFTGVIDKKDVKGTGIGESVIKRFVGANAISPGDKADKQFEKFRKEVTQSAEYKNASQYDKGRMLNRLESDLSDVAYNQSGKSETKLTSKQKDLAENGFKSGTYTDLDASGNKTQVKINDKLPKPLKDTLTKYGKLDATKRKEWFAKENDAEFKYASAKYENDKAEGKISDIQDIKRKKQLAKEEVGSKFSKETRDLYQLGKADLYNYVTNSPKGEKLAQELLDYDRKLVEAGLNPYDNALKFKNGLAPVKGGKKGSGVRTAKARKGRATGKGSKGGKQAAPKMDSGNASAIRLAALGQKKSSGGSFKKQLQVAGSIKKPSITAFKKGPKTTVNVRRTA